MNSGKEQKLVSIISSFFLSIIFISSAFAACPPSVISYWRLDEVSGNQYLELVANNNGTCSGECPAPLENGRIGGAQLFNASTTGIDVPPDAVYDWTVEESFTIEFWIKHDALGSPQEETVIGRDDSGNSSLNWRVGVKTGAAAFTLRAKNGDEHSVTGTSDVTDGAWHHIAAVRDADSNQIILYVDGAIEAVKNATYTAGFDSITAALNIGWLNASPYFRFGGIIDELAIHNLALADSEIQQHYYDGHIGLRWGYCSCDLPVRILPLGDSITKGYMTLEESDEFRVGFRQKLFLDLLHLGYDIDFVGGLKAGSLTIPSFDIDHEGHSGFRDDQVAAGVYNWLTNNPADVILLHIGTNGLQANPTDVAAILNEIDRYSEDIVVVLARIINQKSYSPLTTDFNDNVETMAMGRIANGDKIIIVDQENALTDPEDFADVIHPNMSGYEKMAGPWIEALTQFLPFCNETSPVIFSVPPTKAFNGTYYSYDVKAGGGPKPRYFLSTAPSGAMIDSETGLLDWTPGSFGPFEF
ncbi:MAG: LamG domain-containing protein, partial [Methanosarcinaceae archaeon]|nr:LamG domain-containing protein [Methanosarcinaceae archaeon]